MCGRFAQYQSVDELIARFQIDEVVSGDAIAAENASESALRPRYNVAPRSEVAVVTEMRTPDRQSLRVLEPMQWWLVPSWSRDAKGAMGSMFNARDDRIKESILGGKQSAFAASFRRRRCLIPANGFYEWLTTPGIGKAKPDKQPVYFGLADGSSYAFAGVWDEWTSPDGSPLRSCAVITTDANDVVAPVHNRMPVILRPDDYARWVSPAPGDAADLLPLLRPYPADQMTATLVSRRVNSVRDDDSGMIEPLVNSV